jgi:hypothetical protein
MTDFRALCAELHAAFNTYAVDMKHHDLLERARALLAEPEAEGPTIPSRYRGHEIAVYRDGFHAGYKEALAIAAEPEAVGPSADELIGLALGREPWATWLRSGGCLESAHCELVDLMLAGIACAGLAEQPVGPFVVRHYTNDERPSIKGNGFDGLEIGEDRQEAEEFIAWINKRICQTPEVTND